MRNLKKLLALVVACVMVFGVVASAAIVNFPDVASNAKYAEAVKVLSALNIINGDDKGNFNPDQNVTRAEMAKILCAMISKAEFGKTASGFEDVTADHWASGYVKYAKGLNIINGYNDKEFGPEDNVTYEQAIKLIVAALGYTYMAEDQGGYPSGYMMVAADLKLTNKVTITDSTAPAKRSDIAMLVYNALEVNLMERVTYGTEAKYEPVAKNLLNNKLGVYRVEGMVVNTFKNDTSMDEGEIDYSISKIDANTIKALELVGTGDPVVYALNDYYCEDAAAADLLYYSSNAYLAENEDGDYDVIAVVAKTTKTKEIVFEDLDVLCDETASEVDSDEVMDIANGVFSYWSNADHDDKRPTVIDVAAGAMVTVNNGTPFAVTANSDVIPAYAGTIKVIDTNNDGEYDLFVVKSYDIAVVDSVVASSMTLRLKGQNSTTVNTLHPTRSIALNEDAVENMKELTVTIDGVAAELTDLQKNDVVLIASNGLSDPTFVEIHATRNVVEGKVKSGVNSDNLVEIGDEEYEVFGATAFVTNFPAPGDEGKFYLTSTGVIVYSDTTTTMSNDYAYVYKVGTSSFGDKSLRMFTAAGEDVTYDVADRIEINGVQTSDKKAATKYTAAEMVAIFGGDEEDYLYTVVGDNPDTEAVETEYVVNNCMSPVEIIEDLVDNGTATEKLIAYDVSGTELTKIYLPNGNNADENDFGVVPTATKEWISATNKFKASKTLAEGAKVFMIEPTAEFADWKVVDAATLVNEKEYDVAFYGYNANGTYNVALITSGTMAADSEAAFAYFKEARTTTYGDDDEDAVKVYYIQGGEEKTMFVLDSEASSTVVEVSQKVMYSSTA
ncbi:MAG: S-layer homology domain-containing protein [Clostridia bacterium]|nr:S-layer homology domain-containing protein [Clostridia bacterium]